ncbi:MAG: DapH/DapD/GlmU-related protein [Candidatus Hodarchaeota archaeon]
MKLNQGYQSQKSDVSSSFVASNVCIYGPSKIGENSIIDSFVIVGYPIRPKTQKIASKGEKQASIEKLFDKSSTGSIIGKNNHIRPYTIIYETSILKDNVETGTNVVIREKCFLGQGSIIGSGTVLDSGVTIGKNARIQSNNFIPPKVSLGDNIFLGPGVQFSNDKYPFSNRLISTKVKNGVIIGMGAIILPGIIIGENAVIAAGSIVTKDVPRADVIMGVPAKRIMSREEYDQKQKDYEISSTN